MATVRHASSAPVASPTSPSSAATTTNGNGTYTKRQPFFRTLSRFLSVNKTRPKLSPRTAETSNDSNRQSQYSIPPVPHVPATSQQRGAFYGVTGVDENNSVYATESSRRSVASSDLDGLGVGDEGADVSSVRSTGADTDASMKVFAPSSIAGSVASRSDSASHLTNQTFRSYASTKPTTLLSVDSAGAAGPQYAQPQRIPHASSSSSGASPTLFASLPRSQSGQSTAPGITFSALPTTATQAPVHGAQAPKHTPGNARANPNPLAAPPDNASTLTLASSHFTPSVYPRVAGLRKPDIADEDASLKVLPGSRRNSEESLGGVSTWSAANPLMRGNASIRTAGSTSASAVAALGVGSAVSNTPGSSAGQATPQTSTADDAVHATGVGANEARNSFAMSGSNGGSKDETEAQRVVRTTQDRSNKQQRRTSSRLSRELVDSTRAEGEQAAVQEDDDDVEDGFKTPASPTTPTDPDRRDPLTLA